MELRHSGRDLAQPDVGLPHFLLVEAEIADYGHVPYPSGDKKGLFQDQVSIFP